VVWVITQKIPEMSDMLDSWMREEGVLEESQVFEWMGKRISWGGMSTTMMVKVFFRLSSMIRSRRI
jgi:hypothetical protein